MSQWVHYSNSEKFEPDHEYNHLVELWTYRGCKPSGLWICPSDEWRTWADQNHMECGSHRWILEMGAPDQVCFLRTLEDFDDFCIRYGYIAKSCPMQHRKQGTKGDRFDDFVLVGECATVRPHNLLPLGPSPDFYDKGALIGVDSFFAGMSKLIDWKQAEIERTGHEYPFHLRWDLILKDYAGLVIDPYLHERRHISWYYGWDVPCGVIWDLARAKISQIE